MGSAPARDVAVTRVLALVLTRPDREWTVDEVARAVRWPHPRVLRELNQLVGVGALTDRHRAGVRLVRANTANPRFVALAATLAHIRGPARVVRCTLAPVAGVDRVLMVGRWAMQLDAAPDTSAAADRGAGGEDVGVVVVGQPDPGRLRWARRRLAAQLARPVPVAAVTGLEWDRSATWLVRAVKAQPHVLVLDRRRHG